MKYLDEDVYQAACERIDRALADSDYLYVSFSGGKDSGVLLNLAFERAEKSGRRIGMDMDELLRLKQLSGLAALFKDREFSKAWEMENDT